MYEFSNWLKSGLITAIIMGSMAGGCCYLNRKLDLDDDNLIEENIEALIEYNTGFALDLTPGSSEK